MSKETDNGPVALVTGAGKGIGRAVAEKLAAEHYRLVLNDLNAETLATTVKDLLNADCEAVTVAGDISDPSVAEEMVRIARNRFGAIDCLVNNAGIGGRGKTLLELELDEWEQMIRVDLTSVFITCRAVAPAMIEQQRGRIVNFSSVSALMGVAGSLHYTAAKAGVIAFSKSLARELAQHRINVNVVAPGLIETDMAIARGIDHQRHLVAWPRIGQPRDIAETVRFLLSDGAEFITGQVLSPNGGAYM